jgi:branched-subunit amino acid transport protein
MNGNDPQIPLIILGMALVTFGIRYPLLAILGKVPLPEPILRGLKYVPAAVLTAIIVPATVYQPRNDSLTAMRKILASVFKTPLIDFNQDRLVLSYTNDYLVAGIVSVLVAWRTKNLLLTIIFGMAALLIWRWLLGTHIFG